MGSFCNSICLPRADQQEVVGALERWMAIRGFEREPGPMLFDLDGDRERCAYVLSNRRWTIVLYSHQDEDLRLLREFASIRPKAMYVWLWDNDAWGYDLFFEGDFGGSFSSNSRVFASFEGSGSAGFAERPAGTLETLESWTGDRAVAAELFARQGRRAGCSEESCRDFCRPLGLEMAVSSFDELDRGNLPHSAGNGSDWQLRQLIFRHRAADRKMPVDLHRHDLEAGTALSRQFKVPAQLQQEMAELEQRLRLSILFLRPISIAARGFRWMYRTLVSRLFVTRDPARPSRQGEPASGRIRIDGRKMTNDLHRCRLRLVRGVEPTAALDRPASVFAFRLPRADVPVICTARRREQIEEVLQRPSGALTVVDECYSLGSVPARRVIYELPWRHQESGGFLSLEVIEVQQALYVFLCRTKTRLDLDDERAFADTVASFELI